MAGCTVKTGATFDVRDFALPNLDGKVRTARSVSLNLHQYCRNSLTGG